MKKEITEVRSGTEAENKKSKKKSKSFDENTIRDSETAKERGRNGGIKSGEVRREKKDARETIRYMLDLKARGKWKENLKELGFKDEEQTNMAALQARLMSMAMSGDINAYMQLMKMAGYEPEENRKERESVSSDRRRDLEVDMKMAALNAAPENAQIALSINDEDSHNDVVIYMPKMLTEEECEYTEGEETEAESETPKEN